MGQGCPKAIKPKASGSASEPTISAISDKQPDSTHKSRYVPFRAPQKNKIFFKKALKYRVTGEEVDIVLLAMEIQDQSDP